MLRLFVSEINHMNGRAGRPLMRLYSAPLFLEINHKRKIKHLLAEIGT
jgi:replicative superfamily II helicase